jgi:hypothetical protein
MSNQTMIVIVIVFIIAIIGWGEYRYHQGVIAEQNMILATPPVHDTLHIPVPVIQYKQLPGKIKEVMVYLHDTVEKPIPVNVASLDTVMNKIDSLRVAYWFPPVNKFDIDLRLSPRPVIIQEKVVTLTVYRDPSFLDMAKYGLIGAGVVAIINAVK